MKESTYYSQNEADGSGVRTVGPLFFCTSYFSVYLRSFWKFMVGNAVTIDWVTSEKESL